MFSLFFFFFFLLSCGNAHPTHTLAQLFLSHSFGSFSFAFLFFLRRHSLAVSTCVVSFRTAPRGRRGSAHIFCGLPGGCSIRKK
ncbi:hypothetical protein TRSC58_07643 [Trypanosoma rangeli SC58]|uniref:Secreted protein n=1 Tax=Trypanosoma rangeli SC58 TaxID=429131 RepID=A0A061IUT0_TRYRA|nr:hypothetical protein TRSC58_07643 [Trypanosoma rangeli SC58]